MDRQRSPLRHLAQAMGVAVGAPGVTSADSYPIGHGAIAERLQIDIRTVRRYQQFGIPEPSADLYACRIGKMPWEVWPWYYRCDRPDCPVCPTPEVE